jgi:uncharacterized DUF497 family protein
MSWIRIFWDFEPGGNAEHGLDLEEVEHVLKNPEDFDVSRSSGRGMLFGHTPSGEYITVIYDELDEDTVYPVTAYPIEE